MTNTDCIRLLGEAMYGARWKHSVARDLGIDKRQIYRWLSGESAPHDGHVADLAAIARERGVQILDAVKEADSAL